MNYPNCPQNTPNLCRFEYLGWAKTAMDSPVIYDRDGAPVGGGGNIVRQAIKCLVCKKTWLSSAEKLEDLQGIDREWELDERN